MKYKEFGMKTMDNKFEEKFKELRKGYLNKLKTNFPSFKDLLDEDPLNIQEIYSRVHTISGTSGMYEMSDLSAVSVEFEIYLKPINENPDLLKSEELKNKFSSYLDIIEQILLAQE